MIDYSQADLLYIKAIRECLRNGTRKPNRTGVDTISTFGTHYNIDLSKGFPLLTTKEISWKNIVVEMLWFLSGAQDIKLLQKHGCKFWDAWADEEGRVPSAYGNFWRHFPVHAPVGDPTQAPETWKVVPAINDQLAWIQDTLRENPMSRRMVVSAWAPENAQNSKLPPCHCMFVFNVQLDQDGEKRLCCHLTQRSCDLALGVPYNIASYALLTHLFARFAKMKVGTFSHTLVDSHIYTFNADGKTPKRPDGTPYSELSDHVPGLKEQIEREPRPAPELVIDESINNLEDIAGLVNKNTEDIMKHFQLVGYHPHPAIKFEVAL
jgi:thymidylate synthase